MKQYGKQPIEIASDVKVDNSEMYFYQYLPIVIPNVGFEIPEIPPQLLKLKDLVYKCMSDYIENITFKDKPKRPYIYLTTKCLYVPSGRNLNRMGWHCDGFMSDDINYIWSDCIPTEYVVGDYQLTQDHEKSIEEMNRLLYKDVEILETKNNSIYRLDERVIHRCGYNKEQHAVLRHFVKVSFSKEKYNLKGNSHNYLLDYDWEMKERDIHRNHPIKK